MRIFFTLAVAANLALAALSALAQQPAQPPAQQPTQPTQQPPQLPTQPAAPAQPPAQPSNTGAATPTAKQVPHRQAHPAHVRRKHLAGRHHGGICGIVNGWRAFPNHDPRGYFYTGRVCCCP